MACSGSIFDCFLRVSDTVHNFQAVLYPEVKINALHMKLSCTVSIHYFILKLATTYPSYLTTYS